jgi:hypothetical protein
MQNMIEAYYEKTINDFKAKVIQRAEETKQAWAEGRNIWMNRWADLHMAEVIAEMTHADTEELKAFVDKAYYGK